jgi:hypothetical protein
MKTFYLIVLSLLTHSAFSQGKFFGGSGDGFATATITNIVLPLDITSFTVSKNGDAVRGTLVIASTDAVCIMQLQSATDAVSFGMVDSIQAVYPGLQGQRFEFNDLSPARGISYYRIKITRCDGSFVYSKVMLYRNDSDANEFYTTGNMLYYKLSEKGSLDIFNATGQLVMQKNLINGSGVLSLTGLKTGIYFLRWKQQPVKAVVILE